MEIKVKISGREYKLRASSPENEEVIRKAVDTVNSKIQNYQKNFVSKSETDILSFVALNECIANLKTGAALESVKAETQKLLGELDSYLEKEEQ